STDCTPECVQKNIGELDETQVGSPDSSDKNETPIPNADNETSDTVLGLMTELDISLIDNGRGLKAVGIPEKTTSTSIEENEKIERRVSSNEMIVQEFELVNSSNETPTEVPADEFSTQV
ncbi:hypothetical protein KPH14_013056, partial [Odynerus spinipes]